MSAGTDLEFISSTVGERTIVEIRRKMIQQANGNVAMLERNRLAQESSSRIQSDRVRSPMLDTELGELTDEIETLSRRYIPISLLLDLGEDPRLRITTSAKSTGRSGGPDIP